MAIPRDRQQPNINIFGGVAVFGSIDRLTSDNRIEKLKLLQHFSAIVKYNLVPAPRCLVLTETHAEETSA